MIQLTNYSVFLSGEELLQSINLTVEAGAFFCLIGESGGGKTLLSKVILDLLPSKFQTRGTKCCVTEKMELILQNPLDSMQSNVLIRTQFHHLLKSKGIKEKGIREKMMKRAMHQVGFIDNLTILDNYPYELSGGMCQKTALALALVSNPEIIIADEATSALDVQSQRTILTLLQKMNRQANKTIFFITHDLELVRQFGTHVGIIKEGCLLETGKVNDILTHPKNQYTKELIEIFDDN
ncbi:peptide/nickel transport system ATP-binding protein [Enterococcus sp. DIV2402]|uniref:Peptide/nickel transport system ATP-binding protein n=1 Tax=Candidatus Enterococcus lowellii TaxID=2230877 RepID=A0ABZ2SQR2_9ENTE|nr:ATP-binding cassette domain-containing protein [Enterococcus sp. DIV2402]MBO0463345.1 ABC transporter ATP-binding protein [Enterococcus sp. DIV2402]